jgi:adenine-specific DNA-methyltransferase
MPSNFDEAFAAVQSLAKDFDAQKDFYLSPKYQEAEVRKEFIDKFLIALGWDVNHDTQKNPYEQEVKIERKEHGVSQRRADYAFHLAPNFRDVKFYIEAKKPFGDIATPDNYFQTIRYGWGSKTPIAALFDFEQFEIVDCRFKPDLATALQRNLKRFKYTEYADKEKFAEIYWLFSREAVAGGSLEKYAGTLPKKRGAMLRGSYQSIDEAFLEELDAHRDTLAHIFKNSNPKLDGESLTEATQRTLDRLVFIRFLEDKLIEPQNLVARFGERGGAWGDFIAASRRLDGIYNGIVFKKNDLLDTPTFKVDDDQFAKICASLSHVNSPYDFNAIPIHILGSIYERFLGKVIVATDKRARVEEKPEVRKAGSVYYTPEYIVRYIVENTVGKLIAGKTPAQIAEMRFADIACGSGSFLLGVYDLLIRHHSKFYNENPGKAKKGDVMKREDGLHLSLQKKRDILVNNIYGVDIDNQAVEVAQLSLYLKLLQDETPGSTRQYILDFEQQALLPSLNKNIVCGNSLVGRRVCLVYEEAHSLIPEWNSVAADGDKTATNGTARAILQGRKFGLGCLLVTQRTANVTKTILNQCNTIFAMRTFDETGKEFLSNYISLKYANKLSTLLERQAVFFGRASSCENPVMIRLNDQADFRRVFREKFPPPPLLTDDVPPESSEPAQPEAPPATPLDDVPF